MTELEELQKYVNDYNKLVEEQAKLSEAMSQLRGVIGYLQNKVNEQKKAEQNKGE